AAVWARGQVRELEDRYVTHPGEQTKLEKQIVATSLKFGVLCRFTSFVAVYVKEDVNPDGHMHRITQPGEPAAGWAMMGTDADREELARGALAGAALRRKARAGCVWAAGAQAVEGGEGETVVSRLMDFDAQDVDISPRASSAAPASAVPPPLP